MSEVASKRLPAVFERFRKSVPSRFPATYRTHVLAPSVCRQSDSRNLAARNLVLYTIEHWLAQPAVKYGSGGCWCLRFQHLGLLSLSQYFRLQKICLRCFLEKLETAVEIYPKRCPWLAHWSRVALRSVEHLSTDSKYFELWFLEVAMGRRSGVDMTSLIIITTRARAAIDGSFNPPPTSQPRRRNRSTSGLGELTCRAKNELWPLADPVTRRAEVTLHVRLTKDTRSQDLLDGMQFIHREPQKCATKRSSISGILIFAKY